MSKHNEDRSVGFETDAEYRLWFGGYPGGLLGAQAQVELQGKRYAIDEEPKQYNGSRRTCRVDYVIVRR